MLKLLLALVILWSMYVEQRHNFIYRDIISFISLSFSPPGFAALMLFSTFFIFRPLFQMHPEVDR